MKLFTLHFLIVLISFSVSTSSAKAQSTNWKKFNQEFGFRIELPSYFEKGSLTASGIQYFTTELNEDIMVFVETSGEGSSISLANDYQSTINSTKGISYKLLKETYYVISGKQNNEIYYFKTLVKNGQTFYLSICYPIKQKDIFDSILPRIIKSFK